MQNTKTSFCEEIATDSGVGVNAILAECSADEGTWKIGDLPNTETLRRMILLADWASREPKRWAAYRLYYIDGVTCTQKIALKLHAAERTVNRWLEPVRLGIRGNRMGGYETKLKHMGKNKNWKPKDTK